VETIGVPWWLLALWVVLSAWALLDLLLIPSVRWYLHRRVNRAIDQINMRLDIHIRPFQFTNRQVLIDRLADDPKVIEALREHAQHAERPPRPRANRSAALCARDRSAIQCLRLLPHRLRARSRQRTSALSGSARRLRGSDAACTSRPHATLVFAMNRRSNMDYALVAFLAAEQSALSYAAASGHASGRECNSLTGARSCAPRSRASLIAAASSATRRSEVASPCVRGQSLSDLDRVSIGRRAAPCLNSVP
jgi:glycerol-3-phosphate O-acyltransferase